MTPDLAALVLRKPIRVVGERNTVDDWCDEAAGAIKALVAEREDWARRFKLNDVTPMEWMTRAERAEQRVKDLEAQLANRS